MFRRTISKSISCKGYGTFNGEEIIVTLSPAEANNGIKIIRTDLNKDNIIKVDHNATYQTTNLNTSISNGNCEVLLVEHLISALWGLRITDINIYVNSNEIPLMDGSAITWLNLLENAVIRDFDIENQPKFIDKEIKCEMDDRYIIAKPCDRFKITFTIDFKTKNIGQQTFCFDEKQSFYAKEIAMARTFCTEDQVATHQKLKKRFTNENLVIYGENKINIIDNKLRYNNEAVRHKILDFIGDLYSAGELIIGEFICYKSGHEINRKFIDLLYS